MFLKLVTITDENLQEQDRIQLELEEGQERMSAVGDDEKIKTQQMRSDGKMRWEDSRWKQKRETEVRSERGTEQAASWSISGREKLVSAEDCRQLMEMGGWQPLWLTVNRILVRHIASGEAYGAWHHHSAVSSCNTPTVPPSICLVPLLQPAQTPLVSNL